MALRLSPLNRPLMLFDGDCGFCRAWVARWRQYTGEAVDYVPYQEAVDHFPALTRADCAEAVHLVEPDGTITRAAAAVFRALELGGRAFGARCYRASGVVRHLTEAGYRWVAVHRGGLGRLTRWLYGRDAARSSYALATHLGLRALGLVYLIAITSFWVQADGLIGARGVLPFADWLEAIRPQVAQLGYDRLPTLLWLWPSDAGLHALCAAGVVSALLLMFGLWPAVQTVLLWSIYLSLTVVGQTFMSFQWEHLLLEGGLLAMLIAPWRFRLRWGMDPAPPRIAVFLFQSLVFKLMFLSGWVKLASGDHAWRDLTALTYHYWTQPLPAWTAWYAQQLPMPIHRWCCLIMLAIELGLPFLIWMPRRLRHFAAGSFIVLMLLIAATGNFAYFNLLTVALCFWLIDDRVWAGLMHRSEVPVSPGVPVAQQWAVRVAGASILLLSLNNMAATLRGPIAWPEWVSALDERIDSFRSINSYGLFAVMTTSRPEVIIEGSQDGQTWRAYEFPWKPGEPSRRPRFVAPHQPRLDWQLWFAALGDVQGNAWVVRLMARLAEGSPAVLELVAGNPFPDAPPRLIRARRYRYRFATPAERSATGDWWVREPAGLYCPPLQRQDTP